MTDRDSSKSRVVRAASDLTRLAGARGLKLLKVKARLPGLSPGDIVGIDHLPEAQTPAPPDLVGFQIAEYQESACTWAQPNTVAKVLAVEPGEGVRWINVNGLHPHVVSQLCGAFKVHPLVAEDILHTPQRPRAEIDADRLYICARILTIQDQKLVTEQVSILCFGQTVLTFQEQEGDVWNGVRQRVALAGSRLQCSGADYLAIALLDAVVDHCFPVLEYFGERLEAIEEALYDSVDERQLTSLYAIRRDLLVLRRLLGPLRDVVAALCSEEAGSFLRPDTQRQAADVRDHVLQLNDVLESYRDLASSLTDFCLSHGAQRMNETMRVLTILASFFIPTTFVAGVYGMNFKGMPELTWEYGYVYFWVLEGCIILGLLAWFRRRGWL